MSIIVGNLGMEKWMSHSELLGIILFVVLVVSVYCILSVR